MAGRGEQGGQLFPLGGSEHQSGDEADEEHSQDCLIPRHAVNPQGEGERQKTRHLITCNGGFGMACVHFSFLLPFIDMNADRGDRHVI